MDRESLAGAHQINAQILAGAHEIAQRLLLDRRYAHRVQRIDHQQPQHPLSVTLVSLDLVLRRALDFPGAATTHSMPDAYSSRASPHPVGPASYAARVGPGSPARYPTTFAVSLGSRHERTSPESASSVTASTLRACTSRPAQLRTLLVMVRSFICGCGRRAVAAARLNSPHDRRWGTDHGLPPRPDVILHVV